MPRMGIGMPLGARTSETVMLLVDDPLFENIVGGTLNINYTQFTFNDALHSQDATNAIWAKTNATVPANLTEAPDNTNTANAITNSNNANNAKDIKQPVAIGAGKTYSVSVHLKKGAFNFARLIASDGTNNYSADFNLTTGAVGTSSGIISSSHTKIDGSLGGGGWVRCSITFQAIAGTDSAATEENTPGNISVIAMSADNTTNVQVAVGTVILMSVWGWQIEQDIESSNYQKTVASVARQTTNLADNHKTWDFDGANLMPDSNPRPEGSWLRSSGELVANGGYEELGSNLVVNGTFETAVDNNQWTNFGSPTTTERSTTNAYEGTHSYHIVGDSHNDGTQASATQFTGDYSDGDVVEITAYVYPITASNNSIETGVSNSNRSITSAVADLVLNQWNKVQYEVTITTASNNYITFLIAGSAGEFYLDNVSAKIVDPNNRWTLGTNVTISSGKGNWANSPNNNGLTQSNFITIGDTYEVTFTVSNYSSGSVRVRFPFTGTERTANGTYTEIGVATTDDLFIQGQDKSGTTSTFSVDSVSVKEYAITTQNV